MSYLARADAARGVVLICVGGRFRASSNLADPNAWGIQKKAFHLAPFGGSEDGDAVLFWKLVRKVYVEFDRGDVPGVVFGVVLHDLDPGGWDVARVAKGEHVISGARGERRKEQLKRSRREIFAPTIFRLIGLNAMSAHLSIYPFSPRKKDSNLHI